VYASPRLSELQVLDLYEIEIVDRFLQRGVDVSDHSCFVLSQKSNLITYRKSLVFPERKAVSMLVV
jgi:hypothetical protein